MDLLDEFEWPIGATRVASICGVSQRTAQRWISGETDAPNSAKRLLQLTQRGRIMPETWPNHWRIARDYLDIGHTKICLSAADIEHYFYSVHMWRALVDALPEIENRIEALQKRLPAADVVDLTEYRRRMQELKQRQFQLLSPYTTGIPNKDTK